MSIHDRSTPGTGIDDLHGRICCEISFVQIIYEQVHLVAIHRAHWPRFDPMLAAVTIRKFQSCVETYQPHDLVDPQSHPLAK